MAFVSKQARQRNDHFVLYSSLSSGQLLLQNQQQRLLTEPKAECLAAAAGANADPAVQEAAAACIWACGGNRTARARLSHRAAGKERAIDVRKPYHTNGTKYS